MSTNTPDPELRLWYRRAAAEWNEALPVGNSRLGAMIYGGVDQEILQQHEISSEPGLQNPGSDVRVIQSGARTNSSQTAEDFTLSFSDFCLTDGLSIVFCLST